MSGKRGKQGSGGSSLPPIDPSLIKALSHPDRARTLAVLNERDASPSQIAEELDQPLGNISYHIKTLLECRCIELVDTEPRRGAVEHIYRATVPPLPSTEAWTGLMDSLKPSLSATFLADLVRDAVAALDAGSLDIRPERQLVRTPLVLDEKGWTDVVGAIDATLEWIADIERESAERLAVSGEVSLTASVSMLAYESAPGDPPADG